MFHSIAPFALIFPSQVKKEEKNSLTNPMIAIMAPHGKSNLQLSSKESNPENLKLTPADVLSSVQDPSKKAIITDALKGHAKVTARRGGCGGSPPAAGGRMTPWGVQEDSG